MMSAIVSSRHVFEPNNTEEAFTLAQRLVASRLLPKAITTPEAAFAIILAGREFGVSALQSLRSIHIIDGKIVLSADLMLALARRSDSCVYFRCVTTSNEIATMETKRLGDDEPVRMSFTLADATLAGLAQKDNWRKFPAAMLRARCIAALSRFVYPDIFLGVYEDSELATITTEGHTVPDAEPPRIEVRSQGDKQPPVVMQAQARQQAEASAFSDFCTRITQASTPEALVEVGRDIGAQKAKLGANALLEIQRVYLDRRASLVAEAMAAAAKQDAAAQAARDAVVPPPEDEPPPPPPPPAAQAEAAA